MTMATIEFFQNKYYYPHYSNTIVSMGAPISCTPVGMNLKTGTIRVKGNMSDFMSCNYMALRRDGKILYAWIDDVQFRTADSFDITYSVDPWRTYRSKIDLGTQYIERRPQPTSQRDRLLGAEQDYPDIDSHVIYSIASNSRFFVVQVRPAAGEIYSTTPVQPTPYQFYVIEYNVNQWTNNTALYQLLVALEGGAETENIVTMYSVPYVRLNGLLTKSLPVTYAGGNTTYIDGWKMINDVSDVNERMSLELPITVSGNSANDAAFVEELLRVDHSVQLVVPEAGIINIPDELLHVENLKLRQDVDLFSGASNYMLMSEDSDGTKHYYNQSVRGSAVASIPILSDPYDTYMSQNQNALTTSLIGDVATVAGSVAMMTPYGRAAGAALGIGGGMTTGAGLLGAYTGINSIVGRQASGKDAGNRYSNPPAFLGTALAGNFNNRFWIVITREPVDNATDVHTNYGYQYGKVTALSLPSSGFIKTEGCNVKTTDGSVPRWAIQEINQIFDNGLQVHTS